MDCRTVRDVLDLFEDGALEEARSREVARHVETCPDCRGRLAALQEVRGRLLLLNQEARHVDVTEGVLAAVRRRPAGLAAVPRPLLAAALAVLLLAALLAYPPARAQAAEVLRGLVGAVTYMRSVLRGGADGGPAGLPQLAYVGNDGTLWLVDADGGNRRALTDACADTNNLAWAPDGSRLVCTSPPSSRTGQPGSRMDLRIVDTAGHASGVLPAGTPLSFQWSPSSRYLVYSLAPADPGSVPSRFGLAGADGRVLTERSGVLQSLLFGPPIWAPDRDAFAYVPALGTVALYDVGTGQEQRLQVPGAGRVLAWLTAETLVVATGTAEDDFRFGADLSRPRYTASLLDLRSGTLTRLPQLDRGVPFWVSPDRRTLVYRTITPEETAQGHVGIIDVARLSAVIVQGSVLRYPSEGIPPWNVWFSPDGGRVSWIDNDARNVLYSARLDGSGLTEHGTVPGLVSPDGSKVAYVRPAGPGPSTANRPVELWTADLDGSNAVRIGLALPSFAWRPPAPEEEPSRTEVTGCPIDPAACDFAAQLDAWVQAGDVDAMAARSQAREYECPGPTPRGAGDVFPLCTGATPGERRSGYDVIALESEGEVDSPEQYRDLLRRWLRWEPPARPVGATASPPRLATLGCPEGTPPQGCGDRFAAVFARDLDPAQTGYTHSVLIFLVEREPGSGGYRLAGTVVEGPVDVRRDPERAGVWLAGGTLAAPLPEGIRTFYPWGEGGAATSGPPGESTVAERQVQEFTDLIYGEARITFESLRIVTGDPVPCGQPCVRDTDFGHAVQMAVSRCQRDDPGSFPRAPSYDPDLHAGPTEAFIRACRILYDAVERLGPPAASPAWVAAANEAEAALWEGLRPLYALVTGTGDCLNVRAEPSLGAEVRECAADGVLLRHTGETRDADGQTWLRVRTPAGTEGWTSTAFLEW